MGYNVKFCDDRFSLSCCHVQKALIGQLELNGQFDELLIRFIECTGIQTLKCMRKRQQRNRSRHGRAQNGKAQKRRSFL